MNQEILTLKDSVENLQLAFKIKDLKKFQKGELNEYYGVPLLIPKEESYKTRDGEVRRIHIVNGKNDDSLCKRFESYPDLQKHYDFYSVHVLERTNLNNHICTNCLELEQIIIKKINSE